MIFENYMQQFLQKHVFINDILQILSDLKNALGEPPENLAFSKGRQIEEIKTLISRLLTDIKNSLSGLNKDQIFLSLMILIYVIQAEDQLFSVNVWYFKDKLFKHLNLKILEKPQALLNLVVNQSLAKKSLSYFIYQLCIKNRFFLLFLLNQGKLRAVLTPLKMLRLFKHYREDEEIIAQFSHENIVPEVLAKEDLLAAVEVFKRPKDYPLDEVTMAQIIIKQAYSAFSFTRNFWDNNIDNRALLLMVLDKFFLQTAKNFQTYEAQTIMVKYFLLDEANTFKVDLKILENPDFVKVLDECLHHMNLLLVNSITVTELKTASDLILSMVEVDNNKSHKRPMQFFASKDFSPYCSDDSLERDAVELQVYSPSKDALEDDAVELQVFLKKH